MFKTLRNTDVKNKRVVLRCDLNVPIKDGFILDDSKIKASLETINYTGTEEQWSVITKGNDWKTNYPSDMVINYNYTGE